MHAALSVPSGRLLCRPHYPLKPRNAAAIASAALPIGRAAIAQLLDAEITAEEGI